MRNLLKYTIGLPILVFASFNFILGFIPAYVIAGAKYKDLFDILDIIWKPID
jgi:hypothetical protein